MYPGWHQSPLILVFLELILKYSDICLKPLLCFLLLLSGNTGAAWPRRPGRAVARGRASPVFQLTRPLPPRPAQWSGPALRLPRETTVRCLEPFLQPHFCITDKERPVSLMMFLIHKNTLLSRFPSIWPLLGLLPPALVLSVELRPSFLVSASPHPGWALASAVGPAVA